ncbi:MAG: phage holin family protein [bacterium]|nr:phage holin family protein [bacterium]
MRKKLRTILFSAGAFVIVCSFYPGFSFNNVNTLLLAALFFSIFYLVVRPILKILSLPLNLITFGIFGLLANAIIFYLVDTFIPGFEIRSFYYEGGGLLSLSLPSLYLNMFFSTVIGSLLTSLLTSIFFWIFI